MRINIIIRTLTLLLFGACSWEYEYPANRRDTGLMTTRGLMQVEIAENSGVGMDRIKTIRFIVFTNLASTPKAEKNEFYEEEEFAGLPLSEENGASKVKIVLELGRKANGPNDKLVVAIANEPPGMTETLNAVTSLAELAILELKMSHFMNSDHLSLQPDKQMPMSGAVWTNKVYATVEEAQADQAPVVLSRAVARVDVYLNTELIGGQQIIANSSITLDNTCMKSYFIRHEDNNNHVLGNIQIAVPGDLTQKSWTLSTGQQLAVPYTEPDAPASVHVCTFYTPERYCTDNKLKLDFHIRTAEGSIRTGTYMLNTASDKNGVVQVVNVIRRNNVYRITTTIGANGISSSVADWESEDIHSEL